ncbi:unnamed protein product [Clonostachys chloroleuca]|uniref:Uncharacterized protein n=1 Tax=Clonostachys chloroleuca TaxID=1926264 RepID=A0AA35M615_9HYPO|nr:unnamed protein product [Clonostachys chloroleuca]
MLRLLRENEFSATEAYPEKTEQGEHMRIILSVVFISLGKRPMISPNFSSYSSDEAIGVWLGGILIRRSSSDGDSEKLSYTSGSGKSISWHLVLSGPFKTVEEDRSYENTIDFLAQMS